MDRPVTPRALAIGCLASALAALLYAGGRDARWPLFFVGTLVAISLVVLAGELLGDRRDK